MDPATSGFITALIQYGIGGIFLGYLWLENIGLRKENRQLHAERLADHKEVLSPVENTLKEVNDTLGETIRTQAALGQVIVQQQQALPPPTRPRRGQGT